MRARSLLRQSALFERHRMDAWVAVRNGVGIGLALLAGASAVSAAAGLVMAIGAINVSLVDNPEGYARRARRMLAAAAISGFAAALSFAMPKGTALDAWLIAGVAVGWGFLAGLTTALGGVVADVFVMGLVTFIIFATRQLPPLQAISLGSFAFVGGLLQTSLAVMFWPLRGFGPERRALGKLYLDLARLATQTQSSGRTPLGSDDINRARAVLMELPRDRDLIADRYRSLLSQAERIRVCLLALARLRRRGGDAGDALEAALAHAGRALGYVAESLLARESSPELRGHVEAVENGAARLRAMIPEGAADLAAAALRVALLQLAALAGQLRAAADLAERTTPGGFARFRRREALRPRRLRLTNDLATLRANLDRSSVAFRHAVRIAVGIAIGESLTHLLRIERSYWMPMTIVLVLRPEYGSTLTRAVLRVGGTLAGTLLATGVFMVLPSEAAWEAGAGAVFFFLLRWIGSANYGIYAFFLTALVTLLMAMSGVDPQAVILARGLNTVIGGAIALVLAWAWPTLERGRVRETVARMLLAYRDYLTAVAARFRGAVDGGAPDSNDPSPEERLDAARWAGRLARSNVEASFDRLDVEPGLTLEQRSLLRGMQASSNRFAHAVMSLEAAREAEGDATAAPLGEAARAAFDAFARAAEETLELCARRVRGEPLVRRSEPDLRAAYGRFAEAASSDLARLPQLAVETDRMTNSLNTLREHVARWAALRDSK